MVQCPAIPETVDGVVSVTGNGYHDNGTITCNHGYRLWDGFTEGLFTCGEDGSWGIIDFTCKRKNTTLTFTFFFKLLQCDFFTKYCFSLIFGRAPSNMCQTELKPSKLII